MVNFPVYVFPWVDLFKGAELEAAMSKSFISK